MHPGGPFYKFKDDGVWSIPKGEFDKEDALNAAQREFKEETGTTPFGKFIPLAPIILKSGKRVYAWAVHFDFDEKLLHSNTFELEWPKGSGGKQNFPEVDRGGWFEFTAAKKKIAKAQVSFLDEAMAYIQNKCL